METIIIKIVLPIFTCFVGYIAGMTIENIKLNNLKEFEIYKERVSFYPKLNRKLSAVPDLNSTKEDFQSYVHDLVRFYKHNTSTLVLIVDKKTADLFSEYIKTCYKIIEEEAWSEIKRENLLDFADEIIIAMKKCLKSKNI